MAVYSNMYGERPVQYEGCTLSYYERNGYHDSDWYAVVWDEESQSVIEVEYDTTRCGCTGWAKIDATEDVLRKVYRYYYRAGRILFDRRTNPNQAKEIRKGDSVRVIKGRKIPKGSAGTVFWVGSRYNYYSRQNEDRVGVEIEGERVFLPAEYVEVIGWEDRLIRGKERKRKLRNFAVNSMPSHYRKMFVREEWF